MSQGMSEPEKPVLILEDGVEVDLALLEIRAPAVRARLTTREAELLEYLFERQDRIVTREELLVDVWHYSPRVRTRAVDHTINRLRKKLEQDASVPRHLLTTYGKGYVLQGVRRQASASDGPLGRAVALRTLGDMLAREGLCVVAGAGGIGKTTLARHYVRSVEVDVVSVDLESASTRLDLIALLARALDVPLNPSRDGAQVLEQAIGARGSLLFLLDNPERVAEPLGELLATLRAGAPESRWLVASRRVFGPEGCRLSLEPLSRADGCALFRALAPDSAADEEIEALVGRLDGLPLAIEMAAARVAVLPVSKLLDRWEQQLRLVASTGSGDGRHRTLLASVACSWEMLPEARQKALSSLSVFRGGFPLEGAEALLGDDAIDHLAALQAWSLLRVEPSESGDQRYFLFQAVSEFAAGHLVDPGGVQRVHARWVIDWVRGLLAAREGPDEVRIRAAFGLELANMVAVFQRYEVSEPPLAVSIIEGLYRVMGGLQGPIPRALQLDLTGSESDMAVIYLLKTGEELQLWGHAEGPERVDRALVLAEESGDPTLLTLAETARGRSLIYIGRFADAVVPLRRAVARLDAVASVRGNAQEQLVYCLQAKGDLEEAERIGWEAVVLSEREGGGTWKALALSNLAMVHSERGRLEQAEEELLRAVELSRDSRPLVRAAMWGELGTLYQTAGRHGEAADALRKGLAIHHSVASPPMLEAQYHRLLGDVALADDRIGDAEGRYRRAIALQPGSGDDYERGLALQGLGLARFRSGDEAAGGAHLDEAGSIFRALDDPQALASHQAKVEALQQP